MSGSVFAATFFVVNPFNKFDLYLKDHELFTFTLSTFPAASSPEDYSSLSEYSIKLHKFIIKSKFSDVSTC